MNEEQYWANKSGYDYTVNLYQLELIETQSRPSMLLKPKLSTDENQYCAMYGSNPMEGVCGYGDSPDLAYRDFDKNWYEKLEGKEKKK